MIQLLRRGSFLFLLASVVTSAFAAPGVLDRVKSGGSLVIAYRDTSVPFSYINEQTGAPIGYALDICLRLVEAVARQTGKPNIPLEFVAVTSATRIDVIASGKAHLECGSTTNNAERRAKVAFTIPHFITGARLLVRANSPVQQLEDLARKKLVSTKGSTPLRAAVQANRERMLQIDIVEAPDHARAVEMVEQGQADAFVMDDVLLYGLAAGRPNPSALKVVGRLTTIEPLAIMLPPGDTKFKKLVDEEMRRLIFSREIYSIYDKWFLQPIAPANRALNLPVNYLLRDFWKFPSDVVPY